ncbi:winged helix-turn-helix transcriptional regulator [Ruminococcus sp. 5_1_39BFAA]|uniref:winged helix-turn-helix transcriptional regulator n=1 Tax=Ruminococcus sp. 5_1_39BFAA TaxID=457412 RepID=UPI003568664A
MRLKVKLKNPKITQSEIKEKLNLSRSKVQRTMKKLVNEGVIENIGSHRSGNWKVNKHL